MRCTYKLFAGALLLPLLACNPAFNWRETRSEVSPLRLLLPCKPDKAVREVAMARQTLQMDMQGCEAGDAVFAVSHVLVRDPLEAGPLLAGWRAVVLAHVHASDTAGTPFTLPGGWNIPQAVRLQVSGRRAGGAPVALHAVWFSRVDATGVHLFHAALYADQPMPEIAETFFASLALQ